MENNRLDPTALEEEDLNWEKRLERLRQARQFNTARPMRHWSKNRKRLSMLRPKPRLKKNINWMRTIVKKVLQEYLYRWQLEHNTALAEDGEAAETDAMVGFAG